MPSSHHHHRSSRESFSSRPGGVFRELWDSFWNPPEIVCPKCGSSATVYYDPFFFAIGRTVTGKRRIKCTVCRFVWRPSRKGKSLWEKFRPIV